MDEILSCNFFSFLHFITREKMDSTNYLKPLSSTLDNKSMFSQNYTAVHFLEENRIIKNGIRREGGICRVPHITFFSHFYYQKTPITNKPQTQNMLREKNEKWKSGEIEREKAIKIYKNCLHKHTHKSCFSNEILCWQIILLRFRKKMKKCLSKPSPALYKF